MVTELWARLETPDGTVTGKDPAWKPQRQFLWEVVRDTRGLAREESLADDLELIRTLDTPPGHGPSFALDPHKVRLSYERLYERARAQEASGPSFRLVAPAGSEDWAVVQYFEREGREYALVGGWTGPVLRVLTPEPDQQFPPEQPLMEFGEVKMQIRRIPFAEYFREDFERLFELLRRAENESLRVRFLQR